MTATAVVVDSSNSLPDLAARIRSFHEATVAALKSSVGSAMNAGDLLIEAKAQLKHGQWLPWLAKNCGELSERTVQLYIKLAKNRAAIEKHMKSATVADLTMNEAAALCVLAGRLEKIMEFARRSETATPEEIVSLAVQNGFGVIRDESYDAFAGRSEREQRDWILFGLCIGGGSESAFDHVEWLLRRPFQNVEEWLGPEGDKCRAAWHFKPMPDKFRKHWAKFRAQYEGKTLVDLSAEVEGIRGTEEYASAVRQRPGGRL